MRDDLQLRALLVERQRDDFEPDARRLPRARVRLEIVAGGGANEKWVDAPSNGLLEDQVLRALAGGFA
jgi:hypothetical protein